MGGKYYTGREKIMIPVSFEDFNNNPLRYIKHYLPNVCSKNQVNKQEANELKDIYKGLQDIQYKIRLNGDEKNNNKIIVNHIYRQVEFKKGFMVGNPIDYSIAVSNKNTDDLTYLQKYFKDCGKASKDIEKYEDLFVCGIAEQFVIPKRTDYDAEGESPFELYNVEVGTAFKVYSNDISQAPLFDVVISETITDTDFKKKKVFNVFFVNPTDNLTYLCLFDEKQQVIKNEKQPYNYLPLIEYSLNKNRMGIVELVIAIQNAINIIHSNQIDDIVEFVNAYLVFENVEKKKDWEEEIKKFKANRTLMIKSTNPQQPAKVSLLRETLQHTEINESLELLLQEMYDIVACPKTSGGVTSGGDTGEARILGNGWESAQNQAKVDVTYVTYYEQEFLKKVIYICKENTDKVKDIYASEIDIKFSINMSNNILTKTQALQNLYAMHIPYEDALAVTGITSDTHGLALKWAKFDEEAKTISMKMQSKNLEENDSKSNEDNSNSSDTTDNSNNDTNKQE